ncbi:MAG: ABC transporter ATP-binding protein [Deltaproteobacteria bacterium]|nr:MAG: ABC transporter ATP-binding protein [Deltaproteobacteria bacterium]
MSALLEVRGLTRRFGGLTAVKNVSFAIAGGELTGVLGPNGAGKTTLFNLLTGFVAPDAGEVRFAGADITGLARHRIVSCGMARTFQQPRPFRLMTVEENVAVACLSPRGRQQPGRSLRDRVERVLRLVGLEGKARTPVESLPYGALRRLELARALATGPRLLLLDEPFAGLGTSEIEPLAALIAELHRRDGLTVLMIEHKLREFMRLVRRVIAMDFGEIIADGSPSEIVVNPCVVTAYLGGAEASIGTA